MNHEIQLARPPLPKQSVFDMVSTLWCQLFSTLLYWGRSTKFKIQKYYCWYSVNEYILSVQYLFLRKSTHKIQMHKYFCWNGDTFKKISHWASSVTTFLLTSRWNYCTRNYQIAHALPTDISINKINFEYKSYKLCGLLGVTNLS